MIFLGADPSTSPFLIWSCLDALQTSGLSQISFFSSVPSLFFSFFVQPQLVCYATSNQLTPFFLHPPHSTAYLPSHISFPIRSFTHCDGKRSNCFLSVAASVQQPVLCLVFSVSSSLGSAKLYVICLCCFFPT